MVIRGAVALLAAVLALLAVDVSAARADGAPAGTDLHVAQSLGTRQLTVVLRRVDSVPGPLRVDVVTHTGSPPGTLRLRLSQETAGEVTVRLGAAPGSFGGTLRVLRSGPQELVLDDGSAVASIPFVVPVAVLSTAERLTYNGFAAAGLLLAVALGTAVFARRGWVALVPSAGFVAALAVAITAATLSRPVPAPAEMSGPPVTMLVRAHQAADGSVGLALSFLDSGSGRPVDDLVVRDAAFVHLLVVGPGRGLDHLHPVRVAPGEYRVALPAPEPGHYALAAELTRRGGGAQLLRSPTGFDVTGATVRTAAEAPLRDDGGGRVRVSGGRAGEPTTIVATFGVRADLQLWLGMAGHLIAVGPLPPGDSAAATERAPVWAHVHAMPAGRSAAGVERPDETVAAYGPEVSFTHSFPIPGRYQVWVQAQRGYTLLTVPYTLDIAAGR